MTSRVQFPTNLLNHSMRRVQVVYGGDEWQKNTRRAVNGSAIKTSKLFLEEVCILETEPKASHAQIHVHTVPAFLIDTDIYRSESYGRTLRGFQYRRIVH